MKCQAHFKVGGVGGGVGEEKYHNNPKYWDKKAFANSVDPDQMPQNAASDQGLHYLPYRNILDTSRGSTMDYFKF